VGFFRWVFWVGFLLSTLREGQGGRTHLLARRHHRPVHQDAPAGPHLQAPAALLPPQAGRHEQLRGVAARAQIAPDVHGLGGGCAAFLPGAEQHDPGQPADVCVGADFGVPRRRRR
jgi:hypothetical protein